jgi:hypothetical protein
LKLNLVAVVIGAVPSPVVVERWVDPLVGMKAE